MSTTPSERPLITRSHKRRWARPVLGWVVAFILGLASAWWAADATLSRPEVTPGTTSPVLYTVRVGTVERVMSFTAKATWTSTPAAANSASGTVTSVEAQPGDVLKAGDVLYTVDLRPVVAAEGNVPSFRDLSVGATGADVAQLERFLTTRVGFFETADEEFTALTAAAVEAWQTRLGVHATGVVLRGDLLFLPRLPRRVTLSEEIRVGAQVNSGTGAVESLSKFPRFTITLGADQSELVPLDGNVRVKRSGDTWRGTIASANQTETGQLELELAGRNGRALCASACAQLPVGRPTLMRAELIAVPPTSGSTVPTAALRTTADGTTVVVGADGDAIPVRVLAEANGQAVVSGVDQGEQIQLYGEAAGSDSEPQ